MINHFVTAPFLLWLKLIKGLNENKLDESHVA